MTDILCKQRSWAAIVAGFVAVTLGGFHNKAWSEDIAPPQTLEQRLEALDQKVKILERKNEVTQETADAKAKETTKASAAGDGFSLKSADGHFSFKLKALLQADGRFFIDDKNGNQTNTFLLRRVRPTFEATFFKDYDLLIVPEFANNSSTSLIDAYLDIHPWNFARLRAGKFKPPIGLEHLQSDPQTFFPERSLVSVILPGRDTGVQIHGEVSNGAAGYALAITNGLGDNASTGDVDTNDGKEGTARLWTKPFKNGNAALLQGLHVGFGSSYAKQNVAAPTYRTNGQVTIFTPAATALQDGEKIRLAPELAWYYHSFGFLGEWAQSSQVYRIGSTRFRTVNQAWQAAIGYTLTGEDTTFNGVKPRKVFDPATGGWGAWQIVARYHVLYLDPENFDKAVVSGATSVQRATAYGAGVNWYLNPIVRISTEFEQTDFVKGATTGNRAKEKLALTRLQVNF